MPSLMLFTSMDRILSSRTATTILSLCTFSISLPGGELYTRHAQIDISSISNIIIQLFIRDANTPGCSFITQDKFAMLGTDLASPHCSFTMMSTSWMTRNLGRGARPTDIAARTHITTPHIPDRIDAAMNGWKYTKLPWYNIKSSDQMVMRMK